MLRFTLLIVVGVLWGSQYVFIKMALVDLTPSALTFFRLGLGTVFMALACLMIPRPSPPPDQQQPAPRSPWWLIAIIGILEAGLPALLIAWGEQWIESSLAAILLGTTPLFTIVLSCLVLKQERFRAGLIIAVIVGFIGLLVLFGFRMQMDAPLHGMAGLAILVAALCFATSLVLLARVKGRAPQTVARDLMFWASLALLPVWLIWGEPSSTTMTATTAIVILYLATLGSGAVFLIYVQLIRLAGATFASLSNYLVPIVGVALGVSLGEETLMTSDLVALLIILGALAAANPAAFRRRPA
ncbi:MAG: DMT family transporter [Phycisphaerales bacterium]|nr:DMT family transporter [Phycisphaerales bacterium]